MTLPPFVLASASPARRRLLAQAGFNLQVCPSQFDESQIQSPHPAELVEQLARSKAEAVAPQFDQALILGCDSVLALNGQIHGKPPNPDVAIARWQQMRGQVGELYTGHALIDQVQNRGLVQAQVTRVFFADVSDREIEAYVATGEPLQCAGCFALEGKGSLFIEKIEGCHTNVIGLSMPLLRHLLRELGYGIGLIW